MSSVVRTVAVMAVSSTAVLTWVIVVILVDRCVSSYRLLKASLTLTSFLVVLTMLVRMRHRRKTCDCAVLSVWWMLTLLVSVANPVSSRLMAPIM